MTNYNDHGFDKDATGPLAANHSDAKVMTKVPRHLDVDTLWRRVNALPTQCRDAIRKSCNELEERAREVEAALDQHERHADSRRDNATQE